MSKIVASAYGAPDPPFIFLSVFFCLFKIVLGNVFPRTKHLPVILPMMFLDWQLPWGLQSDLFALVEYPLSRSD